MEKNDALLATLQAIHSCRDSTELLRLIAARSLALVQADRACLLTAYNGRYRYRIGLDQTGTEIAETDFPLSQTVIETVISTGQPLISPDTAGNALLSKRGSILRANIRMILAVPLTDRAGRLLGLLYVSSETPAVQKQQLSTERLDILTALAGQAAIALEQTRLYEHLRALDEAKNDFILIVSHELRTPVTLARGYAGLLADQVPPDLKDIAGGVQTGLERMAAIVNLMLDATQVSQGTLAVNPQPYSIRALLKQVMAAWQEAAKERNLDLELHCPDNDPVTRPVDPHYFELATGHLLQNAIKFTPDGGQITVSLDPTGHAPAVRIIVADSGVGVPPEQQALIFEKFYRAGDVRLHSTGRTKFMGAGPGLGLYLARGIMVAHGGRLWVESEGEGRGSRFIMEFGGF